MPCGFIYRHCGCVQASVYGIRYDGLPDGEDASFFLCRILQEGYLDGITGVYRVSPVYFVSDEAVEAFDRGFTPKEKRRLPGQIF